MTPPAGGSWAIDLSAANQALFRRVFGAMFASVTPVEDVDAQGVDLVLKPSLMDFRISTPANGATKFFEAWISYRVGVYAPGSGRIAMLPIDAYGRSSNPLLGDDEALRQAARRALRDAATALVLKLPDQAYVRSALAQHRPAEGKDGQP